MANTISPKPNSDDLVGGILTSIVVLAAIIIYIFSDHSLKLPYLFVGPLIMAVAWLFTRNKGVSGILVGCAFIVAVIVTCLAI